MSKGVAGTLPVEAPIDPFAAAPAGRYADAFVVVERVQGGRSRHRPHGVRTEHFDVGRDGDRLRVRHDLDPREVDDDLGGLVARELVAPGWVSGSEVFERIFTGLVLTGHADATDAWESFYRNTLRRLDALVGPPSPGTSARGAQTRRRSAGHTGDRPPAADPAGGAAHGSLADYAPVYARAEALVRGSSVLELGCCFGFLSLRLARAGCTVTGSDVVAGTVRLLATMASRLGIPLGTCVADATRVPLPGACVDTVLLAHLLEHLDADDGVRAVAEACRLARHRVLVAVPYEDLPDPAYGHVHTVDAEVLRTLGARSGWDAMVHDHHGGWLVLDRP